MPEPFKNYINPAVAKELGLLIQAVYPEFPYKDYLEKCVPRLEALELKERSQCIADALWESLPTPPSKAISTLSKAISVTPTLSEEDSPVAWLYFPISSLVAKHGLKAYQPSVKLMKALTQRFTSEFAIRPFLIAEQERTLRILQTWAEDKNVHVRRLVSEGSRPRLPWGEQITAFVREPAPLFPLLEKLKDDPEEYVRRSVANNLNDISKDHPDQMLSVVESWMHGADANRKRLIKHACRTLIKQGNPRCLKLLGFSPPQVAKASLSLSSRKIALGEKLVVKTKLQSSSKTSQSLILDFRFHFVKANGKTAPKVFKGSTVTLPSESSKAFEHSFPLKPVTTRRYYSGDTRLELIANGQIIATTEFHLSVP